MNLDIPLAHLVMVIGGHYRRFGHQSLTRWTSDNRLYSFIHAMSLFNTSRLLNKTVLVTGASSGIGAVNPINYLSHLVRFLTTESLGDGDLVREGD